MCLTEIHRLRYNQRKIIQIESHKQSIVRFPGDAAPLHSCEMHYCSPSHPGHDRKHSGQIMKLSLEDEDLDTMKYIAESSIY